MFVKMYDEGDPVGELPAEFVPDTVIDQPPSEDTPKDEGELYPDDFDGKGEKIETEPAPDDTPAPGGEEQEPSQKPAEGFYENDTELLKELDIEGDNIRDVLLAQKQQLADGEKSYNQISPQAKRLETLAQKLGVSTDDVLSSLETLDPRNQAAEGPQWGELDDFLAKNGVEAEHQPFYKNLAGILQDSISKGIQAQFGRLLNSYDGRFDRVNFDRQVDRFLSKADKDGNRVNAEWDGRQEELWQTAKDNKMLGKPNTVDWATRFIKAGETPKTVKKLASKEAQETLQDIERKRREKSLESPGRGTDLKPGEKGSDDPTSLSYGTDRRGKLIDQLEAKGGRLG